MAKRIKFNKEYSVRCSPAILYEFLYTPAGLGEWFAEKVKQRETKFFFSWKGSVEEADLIAAEENEYVVFKWDWMDEEEYFEFRIEKSPVTNETILVITDFAEPNEVEDQSNLWDAQVHELLHRVGS